MTGLTIQPEQVLFCRDEEAGLFAIIAIHDTTFARFVQRLGGQYYTAEDVGIGINAGGMLNAPGDIFGWYDVDLVMERVTGLHEAALRIFDVAQQEDRPTYEVADDLARKKITAGRAS